MGPGFFYLRGFQRLELSLFAPWPVLLRVREIGRGRRPRPISRTRDKTRSLTGSARSVLRSLKPRLFRFDDPARLRGRMGRSRAKSASARSAEADFDRTAAEEPRSRAGSSNRDCRGLERSLGVAWRVLGWTRVTCAVTIV